MLLSLIASHTSAPAVYGAAEVAIDWGTIHPRYVDYMTFSPAGTISVSGIEKGIFTCYEIKSCYEDLYSGQGLNFIGEKNYLVTTMAVYKRILEDQKREINVPLIESKLPKHIKACNPESHCRVGYDIGIYIPIPVSRTKLEEFEDPTPFPSGNDRWKMVSMIPCHQDLRTRSMTEMLFLMMKARAH